MKSWEFLLQKEDSHLWTPITETTHNLDEGKYRLMADASQENFPIEIRVSYQSYHADSPRELIYHGYRSTNSQGLIMILPLTELKPGIWDIRCYGDIMSELLGSSWQQRLQLQVEKAILSSESDNLDSEKNSCNHENELNNSQSQPLIKGAKEYQYSTKADDLQGTEPIVSWPEGSDHFNVASLPPTANEYLQQLQQLIKEKIEPQLGWKKEHQIPVLRLGLNQDNFIISQGESILLSGRVEAAEINGYLPTSFRGKFRYLLQDPQTEAILLEIEEEINEEQLPFIFNYALEVPETWEIPLLAGEVSLETLSGIQIDYQSFTVTTDLSSSNSRGVNYTITLSNPVNNTSFAFDLYLDENSDNLPLNVDLPEPTRMSKNLRYSQVISKSSLPPKINNNSSQDKTIKTIQLPAIPKPKSISLEVDNNSPPKKSSQLDIKTKPKNQDIDKHLTEKKESFQLLDLEERFISRLNALAEKY